MYRAVFFDLDGTLLPVDTHAFMRGYFAAFAQFFDEQGCDARRAMEGIRIGTDAMFAPDGVTTNAERFWPTFLAYMEGEDQDWQSLFTRFYTEVFPLLGAGIEPDPKAACAVDALRTKGYRLMLATNPLFPPEATAERLRWTGADPAAFERVTAYHNSRYAKPRVAYYEENLQALGLAGNEVLMVGNDPVEDAAICELGADLFLLTDHLVDRGGDGVDPQGVPHGNMDDLLRFIDGLPNLA